MHVVKDGQRSLSFEGTMLSSSTSKEYGRTRWVEFELYRTNGGQYVLSRVGKSICYHRPACSVVSRNHIDPISRDEVDPEYVACPDCQPLPSDRMVCPEQPRHWAQVSETPDGVLSSLHKYDEHGTRYLTHVAKRLLADAAGRDEDIRDVFLSEHVE